ncbi:solute carrier family 23 member 1-like isoform X2 [Ylistrum balloti]|uniref:solute carrier family 23 member 1-like isoform X2 n=1 Tax=Ylistrum balloti TaxID=509963 RepID=UPI002905F6C4|nr:solute carrier family 23 member 1-like isoform X2 [Ylistrum balloti]
MDEDKYKRTKYTVMETMLECDQPDTLNEADDINDSHAEVTALSTNESDEPQNDPTKNPDVLCLRYGVNDNPPVHLSLILALQNVMLSFGANLLISFTIADLACAERNDLIRVKLFCTSVFMVGLTTIVQSAFGMRLPMFQGASGAFLGPLLSMRTAGIWSCDFVGDVGIHQNSTNLTSYVNASMVTRQEMVYIRVTELQGSLMVAGLVTEVLLAGTGFLGYLANLVGPITICATITSLGISIYPIPISYSSSFLPVALCGSLLMILHITYLAEVKVPIPKVLCSRCTKTNVVSSEQEDSQKSQKLPMFRIFSILLSVIATWILCAILTLAGVFPDDPKEPSYNARTDRGGDIISISPWFYFPYPGQFGAIRFNMAVFIGFVNSYLCSSVESLGDYIMVSRVTGTFPPPRHAINRGILTEGVLGIVAGALGAGHATTSFSDNIVLIQLTQVASRSVMILAGFICLLFGVFGKVGAVMASIPDPVIGGVYVVTCGLLVATGISSLKKVDLSSTRNIAVLGISLYLGLVASEWTKLNKDSINTGHPSLDQVLKVTIGNQMFVAGLTSVVLDNTVKGIKKSRGVEDMTPFKTGSQVDNHQSVYNVPGISRLQRNIPILRHLPFFQPYRPMS